MSSVYVVLPKKFLILHSGKMYRALLKLTVGKTPNFVEIKSIKQRIQTIHHVLWFCSVLYFAYWNVTYKT